MSNNENSPGRFRGNLLNEELQHNHKEKGLYPYVQHSVERSNCEVICCNGKAPNGIPYVLVEREETDFSPAAQAEIARACEEVRNILLPFTACRHSLDRRKFWVSAEYPRLAECAECFFEGEDWTEPRLCATCGLTIVERAVVKSFLDDLVIVVVLSGVCPSCAFVRAVGGDLR